MTEQTTQGQETPIESTDPRHRIGGVLAFFASCIRSGEAWDKVCEDAHSRAREALEQLSPTPRSGGVTRDGTRFSRETTAHIEAAIRSYHADDQDGALNLCAALWEMFAAANRQSPTPQPQPSGAPTCPKCGGVVLPTNDCTGCGETVSPTPPAQPSGGVPTSVPTWEEVEQTMEAWESASHELSCDPDSVSGLRVWEAAAEKFRTLLQQLHAAAVRGAEDREPARYDQTPDGCWVACIAGLTDIPHEELAALVPRLPDGSYDGSMGTEYHNAINALLRQRGWRLERLGPDAPKGYAIGSGTSPRGAFHAVIVKDGRLWHDPHPSRAGVAALESFEAIVPLADSPAMRDPASVQQWIDAARQPRPEGQTTTTEG